ncbi:MAG TPA: AI-2E family transporter [Candidatus Omnitrophota bacterium]|nr:AI-2E family transporter [Candidatus Omnitrophota bacterium]
MLMKQEQIVSYFFLGFFLFVLYQIILIFSPFFAAISWAAILAFAFYPVYVKLQDIPRVHPLVAAFLAAILVILIVVIPAAFTIVSLMQESVELYSRVSSYISAGSPERLLEQIRQTMKSEWAEQFWPLWSPVQRDVSDLVLRAARGIGNTAAVQLAYFTKNLFLWILNLFLIAFLLFFFFRDGKTMYEFIYQMTPMVKKNKNILADKINETFSAVIRGQFLTSIIQGTLAGFTFWMLGLPLPFLFGFLTFLTSMIPLTGAATVWVPFDIYLFVTHQSVKAVILLIIGTFAISLSDNLLKPLLIGEKTKLPAFLLFLGILGSMKLYGFTGIFLGPVLLSLFFALAKIFREEYQAES